MNSMLPNSLFEHLFVSPQDLARRNQKQGTATPGMKSGHEVLCLPKDSGTFIGDILMIGATASVRASFA